MKHMTLQQAKESVERIQQYLDKNDYEAASIEEKGLHKAILQQLVGAKTTHQFRHAQKLAALALAAPESPRLI